jgi:hypothetical protein
MAERVDKGMLMIVAPSGARMINSGQMEGWHRAHNKTNRMTANAFHYIAQVEARLWDAADLLRANSNLPSSEHDLAYNRPLLRRLMSGELAV